MKRITALLCFGLIALLLTGAALDKYTVAVNSQGQLLPPFTGFFTNNAANIRGALTNDFVGPAALNTESNRINGLVTITDGLGTASTEDAVDLLNRANHTGVQAIGTITDLQVTLDAKALDADLDAHTANTANPHAVTKTQVGLGSVENYPVASQAQAQAGTDNATYMTPLRTAEAITALGGGGGGGGGGKLFATASTNVTASSTTIAQIPFDDSPVQSSEGVLLMSCSITNTSTAHTNRIYALVHLANAGNTQNTIALFRGAGTTAIAVSSKSISANFIDSIPLAFDEPVPSTGVVTYHLYIGSHAGSTITVNGSSGSRKMGGGLVSSLTIREEAP